MNHFSLSVKAKEDLRDIAIYTEATWGREQRNIYIKQFDDAFHLLAKRPHIGKACDFIRLGYLKYPQSSHVIFYRLTDDSDIEIIRILHKSMDIESKLSNAP